MTNNVFSGTLKLTQSINHLSCFLVAQILLWFWSKDNLPTYLFHNAFVDPHRCSSNIDFDFRRRPMSIKNAQLLLHLFVLSVTVLIEARTIHNVLYCCYERPHTTYENSNAVVYGSSGISVGTTQCHKRAKSEYSHKPMSGVIANWRNEQRHRKSHGSSL